MPIGASVTAFFPWIWSFKTSHTIHWRSKLTWHDFKNYVYKLACVWRRARGTDSCELLGTKFGSSAKAGSSQAHLNCWVISPGSKIRLHFFFLKNWIYLYEDLHTWMGGGQRTTSEGQLGPPAYNFYNYFLENFISVSRTFTDRYKLYNKWK